MHRSCGFITLNIPNLALVGHCVDNSGIRANAVASNGR